VRKCWVAEELREECRSGEMSFRDGAGCREVDVCMCMCMWVCWVGGGVNIVHELASSSGTTTFVLNHGS
jgi:hypothetical protein